MQMIVAPNDSISFEKPSVFLGGAITGAPDWQASAIEMLSQTFATCFNPRRPEGFVGPAHPKYHQLYREQVSWEHKYLLAAEVVLFWLPKEAAAITTRFEIGWYFGLNYQADKSRPLHRFTVGIEPGVAGETYYRIALPEQGVPVHSSLEDTCNWAAKLASEGQNEPA